MACASKAGYDYCILVSFCDRRSEPSRCPHPRESRKASNRDTIAFMIRPPKQRYADLANVTALGSSKVALILVIECEE